MQKFDELIGRASEDPDFRKYLEDIFPAIYEIYEQTKGPVTIISQGEDMSSSRGETEEPVTIVSQEKPKEIIKREMPFYYNIYGDFHQIGFNEGHNVGGTVLNSDDIKKLVNHLSHFKDQIGIIIKQDGSSLLSYGPSEITGANCLSFRGRVNELSFISIKLSLSDLLRISLGDVSDRLYTSNGKTLSSNLVMNRGVDAKLMLPFEKEEIAVEDNDVKMMNGIIDYIEKVDRSIWSIGRIELMVSILRDNESLTLGDTLQLARTYIKISGEKEELSIMGAISSYNSNNVTVTPPYNHRGGQIYCKKTINTNRNLLSPRTHLLNLVFDYSKGLCTVENIERMIEFEKLLDERLNPCINVILDGSKLDFEEMNYQEVSEWKAKFQEIGKTGSWEIKKQQQSYNASLSRKKLIDDLSTTLFGNHVYEQEQFERKEDGFFLEKNYELYCKAGERLKKLEGGMSESKSPSGPKRR